jgi:Lar family restriction alleviation protein
MKPCPFCGGKGVIDSKLQDGCKPSMPEAYAYFVVCKSCAATGGWAKTEGNAVRFWNMREDDN